MHITKYMAEIQGYFPGSPASTTFEIYQDWTANELVEDRLARFAHLYQTVEPELERHFPLDPEDQQLWPRSYRRNKNDELELKDLSYLTRTSRNQEEFELPPEPAWPVRASKSCRTKHRSDPATVSAATTKGSENKVERTLREVTYSPVGEHVKAVVADSVSTGARRKEKSGDEFLPPPPTQAVFFSQAWDSAPPINVLYGLASLAGRGSLTAHQPVPQRQLDDL
ncbi:hypothetical protein EIP86_006744, partial [Pleurotus ostreatoroseus]